MRRLTSCLFALAGLAAVLAPSITAAQDAAAAPPATPGLQRVAAVIELFTSQGCSSCPPADALLRTYAERRDVMALSLPVDYWDYIGWKDTLAQPKNADRQRLYAKSFGIGPVYTPQAVISGAVQALGSSQREIDAAIELAKMTIPKSRVPASISLQESAVVIEAEAREPEATVKEATIWLVIVQKQADVDIKRGENAGRRITYANVVKSMTPIAQWNGLPTIIRLAPAVTQRPDTEDAAIIVQEGVSGPLLGAAWLHP